MCGGENAPRAPRSAGCRATHCGLHPSGIVHAMRFLSACVALVAVIAGCTAVTPRDPRCLDLDAELCDAAWQLAQPLLRPDDGEIRDAVIGRAGGAAECFPAACPEFVAATVYYRSGVEHSVTLQVTGGLRVTGSERVYRGTPIPEDGGMELPPPGKGQE